MKKIVPTAFALLFLVSCNLFRDATESTPSTVSLSEKHSSGPATWKCLGPTGMPNRISSFGGDGIGQINRLTFDPLYDGINNRTIYACSSFGGLWRSEDDGMNWSLVNTDHLPSTSVADVCINPLDRREIFISTGFADAVHGDLRSPNWAHINPMNASGIFRSRDYGQTWEDISGNFLDDFNLGGVCREMAINPLNPDQIFVATSHGVFRSNNARQHMVTWENVCSFDHTLLTDFRGLAIKPDESDVIYASSTDIFRSNDGGNNWHSLTGPEYLLDLENLPDDFKVKRINLTVTPAAPERLYAYLYGERKVRDKTYDGAIIAMFKNNKWHILDQRYSQGITYFAINWMAIAVSPVDANLVYYGNSRAFGSENIDSVNFGLRSPYTGNGFHADIHDLKFQPNVENPGLFCGNHGGVSFKKLPNNNQLGWEYRNKGLQVSTIWSFDDSNTDENLAVIATQDNGTLVYYDTLGHRWHYISGGDGYAGRIDNRFPRLAFISSGDRSFSRFNYDNFRIYNEMAKIPRDARWEKESVIITKSFPLINHPETGEGWFGFTEIYSKNIGAPSRQVSREELWTRQSDIYKSEHQGWRRQITEIAVHPENPDIVYAATAGQQNTAGHEWQLPSGLYKSEKGGLDGITGDEKQFLPLDFPGRNYHRDTLAIITGIVPDPENEDRVWISLTGILPQYRIWRSDDGGTTWNNDDPDGVFSANPVNALAYDGKYKKIYAGTDRGLFIKAANKGWEKITSFPSVRITEIKINEGLNRIRISTFGRGLWEGPRNI